MTTLRAAELGLPGRRARAFDLLGSCPPPPRLAVVGSRAARRAVLDLLPAILERAQSRGWSLVSGGALGVDGAAHRAALTLDMAQIAILPCGRDQLYPPGHAALFSAMVAAPGASLLFAHPAGTPTVRAMFASRNAIVVGLADAVLVAQAGLRSGSIGTGRLALRRGLPVAAVAGSPGCGALIAAGASPLPEPPRSRDGSARAALADRAAAWLDRISGRASTEPPPEGASSWPPRLRWLVEAFEAAGPAGLCVDALADPAAALVALCEAELLGLVAEASPGRWVVVLR